MAGSKSMELSNQLAQMDAQELRNLTATLLTQLAEQKSLIASRDQELKAKQLKIDQLTHEMAILRRYRFDRKSEQMDPVQRSLLDESIDADIEAIFLEIEALKLPLYRACQGKAASSCTTGLAPAPRDPPRAREDPMQLRLRS
jgi:transposase